MYLQEESNLGIWVGNQRKWRNRRGNSIVGVQQAYGGQKRCFLAGENI
jgi:hypothetical protein